MLGKVRLHLRARTQQIRNNTEVRRMTAFISAPFFVSNYNRQRGLLSRDGPSPFAYSGPNGFEATPSCRMRDNGGFQLPPRVPTDETGRRRAIELLGCCTQRKRMRAATAKELETLIGHTPHTRLIAQQWKGALQRDEAKTNRCDDPLAFKTRNLLHSKLSLPDEKALSRCYFLLEHLRQQYAVKEDPDSRILEQLVVELGDFPKSERDVHHYTKSLASFARERRRRERRPPKIPTESLEDLRKACMLLGTYAVKASVGRQTATLESLLGAIPRTRNVATSWKKLIEASIRKIERENKRNLKRADDDAKRLQRRMRHLQQEERTSEHVQRELTKLSTRKKAILDERHESVLSSVSVLSPPEPEQKKNTPYIARLYKMLGRIFEFRR